MSEQCPLQNVGATLQTNRELIMRAVTTLSALAIALAFGMSGASAAQKGQGRQITDSPSHASTTGTSSRSDVAGRHGANNPRFCPPGQKKKAGKGSAFNC